MDEWMGIWEDGWMDRLTVGQADRQINTFTDRRTDR